MFLPLGDLSDPGIGPLSLESPGLQAGFYCWAIRDFNFLVVVSFKCICQDFFFNHEKVLKILSYPLFINWDHGFSLRYVNVVHCCLLAFLLRHFSHVLLCGTPWATAHQAHLSTGFSRKEHWSGLPFPSPTWCMIPMHFTMMKHSFIPGKITLAYIVQFLLYELI